VPWLRAWDIWLIFFLLGVIVPWRGRVRLKELLARGEVCSRERMGLYLSTMGFQWLAAGIVGWRAWAHGFGWRELAIVRPSIPMLAGAAFGSIAIGTFQWFNLRRVGGSGSRGDRMRQMGRGLLPQSRAERVTFLGLALTAGLCEEFLYRGFTIAVFVRLGLSGFLGVLLSSILFGLAHLYQGRGGLIGTMILGLLFGTLRVLTGTLIAPIFCHSAVDVVAGIAGPRFLLAAEPGASKAKPLQSAT
jgi:uncharacterized protein